MRSRSTFRQREVTRLTRAVNKAGLPVERVELRNDGLIAIITGKRFPDTHVTALEEDDDDLKELV